MAMIKGITVTLYERELVGEDGFKNPIYDEHPVQVDNVLVYPASNTEILNTLNLTGRKAVYNLAVPKEDQHTWENNRVDFFGSSWRVIGFPQRGIGENIPLEWNDKWMVERYE